MERLKGPWWDREGHATRLDDPLLYRFEAQLEFFPVGLVPEGIRMTVPFEGEASGGVFDGARVWGTDHLLIRPDGVGVVDAQKTISGDGFHILEHVRGYCLPPPGFEMPSLESLLDPAFQWPDVLFPVRGFSSFRAGDPDFRHLNGELARVDGWADFSTGSLAVETTLIHQRDGVAPPRGTPAPAR